MSHDNDFSLGPVPKTARKGIVSLTLVMLGLTFSRQACGQVEPLVLDSLLMIFPRRSYW